MRIRKRFLLSSLSSLPLSDPQPNRSSPVLVQQQQLQEGNTGSQPSDSSNQPPPPPSDQNQMIRSDQAKWVFSGGQKELEGEETKEDRWEEREKSNDTKKGSILGADVDSHQEVERWCEGDKVVPPKKRRGSFERRGENKGEKEKIKMKAKMKSKTNRKCVQYLQNGDDDDDEEITEDGNFDDNKDNNNTGGVNKIKKTKKKKVKRGNVIMEGSRCSRVNGRGWRCGQQTLVGYSLCEHHLGKGTLRSINAGHVIRNRTATANSSHSHSTIAAEKNERRQFSAYPGGKQGQRMLDEEDDDDEDDDYEDQKKPLMITKKRKKIGIVKARSISSLLGQTNDAVVVVNDSIHHKTKTAVDEDR